MKRIGDKWDRCRKKSASERKLIRERLRAAERIADDYKAKMKPKRKAKR